MEDESFPRVPHDLLEALNKRFPEKTPPLSWSLDQIREYSGRRAVVGFLYEQYRLQNEAIIDHQVLSNVQTESP